jgi:uncharacterized membrane protein YukC
MPNRKYWRANRAFGYGAIIWLILLALYIVYY